MRAWAPVQQIARFVGILALGLSLVPASVAHAASLFVPFFYDTGYTNGDFNGNSGAGDVPANTGKKFIGINNDIPAALLLPSPSIDVAIEYFNTETVLGIQATMAGTSILEGFQQPLELNDQALIADASIVMELNAPGFSGFLQARIDAAQQVVEKVETSTDGGITWTDITADTGRIIDTSFPDTAVLVYQIPPSVFIGSSPPSNTGFRTTLLVLVPEPSTGLLLASGLMALAVGRRRTAN